MQHGLARIFACIGALALLGAACGGDDPITGPAEDPALEQESAEDRTADAAADPDAAPEDTVPEDAAPEDAAPEETVPEDTVAGDTVAGDTAPEQPEGPPHVAELPWGNFELAEPIAAKLASGEALNFVISLAAIADSASAASLEHGWREAAAEAAESHGIDINARVIGPNRADADAQAAAIESLIETNDIDCLAVEAAGPRLLTDAIDAAADAGVPVFAAGGDSPDSKRFAYYGIDDYAAGETAGQMVGQWAADGGILVRRAGVLTGDAGNQRSFDLMRGFVEGLTEIHSGIEFVNGPADVDSLGFEPVSVYDATEAWVLDNADADIVFHTDSGLEHLAAAMADHLLYGDMYAVGFHLNQRVTDYIRERLVVTAMAQDFSGQARAAALACADFLLAGVFETGHVVFEPVAVTLDNVDERDWTLPENQ